MNAAGVAVVVVTCNSEETIDECLLRLRTAEGVVQLRVVDNASHDDTLAIVQRHALADSRVRFIANPDNPGFAVACNQGAAACDAPWLVFLNPDCFIEADVLARLRTHAMALGGALVGADLVDEGGASDLAARRRHPVFVAMLHQPAHMQLGVPAVPGQPLQQVDAISGALMVLPRVQFERLRGFDAGYRLHVEDLDLCRRACAAGIVVACANDVRVVHVRGVSSRSRVVFVEWHKHRGLWRYFQKFEADQHGLLIRLLVFALIWARFPWALLRMGLSVRR